MKKIFLFILFGTLVMAYNPNLYGFMKNDKISLQKPIMNPNYDTTFRQQEEKQEIWLESLITKTPQEGRELAIKMARKTIGAIQSDPEVKKKLRKEYAEDPEQLILSAQVVATEFRTVAEANNYWREQ